MRRLAAASLSFLVLGPLAPTAASGESERPPLRPVHTYSIVARDPVTGEMGVAVQSHAFAVGGGVTWAEAGVGAAATQAIVDVSYGPRAIELLRKGLQPEAIVKQIWESDPDPQPERWTKQGRQFAVIDQKGNTAVFTGPKATEWAGHKQGKYAALEPLIWEKGFKAGRNLGAENMEKLRHVELFSGGAFHAEELDIGYPAEWGANGMEAALASLCAHRQPASEGLLARSSSLATKAGQAAREPVAARQAF